MKDIDLNKEYENMVQRKQDAVVKILKVLKSGLMVMSQPTKAEALDLARVHDITVEDLIETWSDIVMKT